ncbi:MAG: prepilin-type N-terminal cleavage/methylation domain-containing protein [Bacillota bacterium]|nr:prepilin-type N-terminal cleavage/methylation domain-containing protein [Bacillota bacterium]
MLRNNNKGFTLIELTVVLVILAIVGTMVYSLVGSGTKAYKEISENSDEQSDARIAMSYITMRLRQNDFTGGYEVRSNTMLVIKDTYGNDKYRLYKDSDSVFLVEDTGQRITAVNIAKINSISFQDTGNGVEISITYGNENKTLDTMITMRSDK